MIRIANGFIIDGTGRPGFYGDLLIEGDRIVDVVERRAGHQDGRTPGHQDTRTKGQGAVSHTRNRLEARCRPGVLESWCPVPSAPSAPSLIDATGCLVTPGFIDAHTHSDAYLVLEPDAPSKITQGITTEINGQCGGSVAPRYGEARLSSDWAALLGERLTWRSLAEYRAVLEQVKPAVNTVQFIGHNTLRSSVVGYAGRVATPDELRRMVYLLEQALDEGGKGLTTGLIYQPGKYSTPDEVLALAKATAAKGGFYATHMRSEGDRLLESIDEVIDLARATGIRAEISHLKTSGKENWHKIDAALDMIEAAMNEGLLLGSDRYPYCAAGTDLDVILPDWAQEGAAPAETERLKDPALRARIAAEIDAQARDWSTVMIGGTWHPDNKPYSGKTVAEIIKGIAQGAEGKSSSEAQGAEGESSREAQGATGEEGKRSSEAQGAAGVGGARSGGALGAAGVKRAAGSLLTDILLRDGCKTGAFFFTMCEENLAKIYARPWIVPGSDASLRAPWGPLGADHPHPRAYATMPEFYRRVRALGFTREATIARMTSAIARRFELRDRGELRKGAFADVVVWREGEFKAQATFDDPHRFTTGVELVMVNGAITCRQGSFTGERRGRFL